MRQAHCGPTCGPAALPLRDFRRILRGRPIQGNCAMAAQPQSTLSNSGKPEALYDKLEERILDRDQKGASDVYYDLVRAGRPMTEIIAEGVRIHAPYTHVPYHERIDDGYPHFVHNDHCLLSARATINLAKMLPDRLSMLPM